LHVLRLSAREISRKYRNRLCWKSDYNARRDHACPARVLCHEYRRSTRRNANSEQRRELEAIFTGKKAGLLEPLWGAVISKWLPTETTDIKIGWAESPSVSVGNVGQATLSPLEGPGGTADKGGGRCRPGRISVCQHGFGQQQRQPMVGSEAASVAGRFGNFAPVQLERLILIQLRHVGPGSWPKMIFAKSQPFRNDHCRRGEESCRSSA
jgi:hypothetical protein